MMDEQKTTTIEDLHQPFKKKSILEEQLETCGVLMLLLIMCVLAVGTILYFFYVVFISFF